MDCKSMDMCSYIQFQPNTTDSQSFFHSMTLEWLNLLPYFDFFHLSLRWKSSKSPRELDWLPFQHLLRSVLYHVPLYMCVRYTMCVCDIHCVVRVHWMLATTTKSLLQLHKWLFSKCRILNHWKIHFICYDLFKQCQIIWETEKILITKKPSVGMSSALHFLVQYHFSPSDQIEKKSPVIK